MPGFCLSEATKLVTLRRAAKLTSQLNEKKPLKDRLWQLTANESDDLILQTLISLLLKYKPFLIVVKKYHAPLEKILDAIDLARQIKQPLYLIKSCMEIAKTLNNGSTEKQATSILQNMLLQFPHMNTEKLKINNSVGKPRAKL